MKRHYIDVHKLLKTINFYQLAETAYFAEGRCDDFLPTTHFKKVHDFLLHYGSGKYVFEKKPLNYTTIGEIQKYEINFSQHSHGYDFYNSERKLG